MKCNKCGKEEGRGKQNICRKCWRKEHTEKNREKLKGQATERYLRNKESRLKTVKKWHKNNKEKVKNIRSKYAKTHKELEKVRSLTRYNFNDLKSKSSCQICGSKKQLEFHHSKPYNYKNFIIVCHMCHRGIEGRLADKNYLFTRQGELK